jgi:hypothetical protein
MAGLERRLFIGPDFNEGYAFIGERQLRETLDSVFRVRADTEVIKPAERLAFTRRPDLWPERQSRF